ncbi:MAG: hypothetical protein WCR36_05800 [Bacteroidaceae bacterium]
MKNLGEIQTKKIELKQLIDLKEKEMLESGEKLINPIIQLKEENGSIKNKFSFGVNAIKWFMAGKQLWSLFGGLSQFRNKRPVRKPQISKRAKGLNMIIKLISTLSK